MDSGWLPGQARHVAMVLVVAVVLGGCAELPSLPALGRMASGVLPASPGPRNEPEVPDDPVLAFLARAADGESAEVSASTTGPRIRVVAGRLYHAASGRRCRAYRAVPAQGMEERGLACERSDGRWERAGALATGGG